MEESIWGAAPCAIVLIILGIQFFRPSVLGWSILELLFLAYGATVMWLACGDSFMYFLGAIFGFLPFLALLKDQPKFLFARASATKILLTCITLSSIAFSADANQVKQSSSKKINGKKCSPVGVNTEFPKLPSLEGFVRAPIIAYEINEHGEVTEVKVKQSSGSSAVDSALVEGIKKWTYKPPACGPVGLEMSVMINIGSPL
jgi:TonB family protein